MRRRLLRRLVVTVVVLAGLFVAADRLAVTYAQNQAAQRIKTSQDLSAAPAVDVKGFPFLTQVLDHRLDEVTVTAEDVATAPGTGPTSLRISRFAADLHGVTLSGDFRDAVADRATGSALVSYADLSAVAPDGATVAYAGQDSAGRGQVKVTFSLPGLAALHRGVISSVSVSGGDTVRLSAKSVPRTGIPAIDDAIRGRTGFSRTLSGLPAGLTLSSVTAGPDGIRFTLAGRHVNLTG